MSCRGEGGNLIPNPLLERDSQPFVQAYEILGQVCYFLPIPGQCTTCCWTS